MSDEQRVHPDCRNASNQYHECSEYCFTVIAQAKARMPQIHSGSEEHADDGDEEHADEGDEEHADEGDAHPLEENVEGDFQNLTGRKKKMAELRKKLAEAKKQNQTDITAEKKRLESRPESRGISKQKWVEERKKRIGKLLDANGLDMKSAYMLDTQEMAEAKYKKWEKDPAPVGWDGFRMKEADPEFYREASSLQYGKAPDISEDKLDKMVKELKDREEKAASFSRRRRFLDEKDIDSINDRNEHFNKKIESGELHCLTKVRQVEELYMESSLKPFQFHSCWEICKWWVLFEDPPHRAPTPVFGTASSTVDMGEDGSPTIQQTRVENLSSSEGSIPRAMG